MLFPLWSFGTKDPQNTDDDATFDVKKPEFNGKKPESEVHVSPSSSAKTKKHDDKTNREAQGKSPIELSTGIEAIRLFLAYASFMGFMVYQIDVKSAFLDETIKEEVYVYQPSGFEDLDYPDKVYVDDIIFGSTNKDLCKAFEKLMKDKFQTSSMGELTFFLDASEGFDQILDFLNANSIQYALTINPIIYVSCIKEFWSSVLVKKTNDVVRLQALIDRKKVIITKDTVCQALRLDDAESIDCLPNKEIFTELARMGAKRIAWNEFSSPMASAVICLATVVDDVAAVDVPAADAEPTPPSPTHATTPPPPQQLPSTSQVAPTPPPSTGAPPSSPPQQPQPSKPTTISMELLNTLLETCTALTRRDENLEQDKIAQALKITKLKQRVRKLERKNKLKALGGIIDLIDADKDVTLEEVDAAKNAEDDEPKPTEINEVIEVVTTTKLMTEVVIAAAAPSEEKGKRRQCHVEISSIEKETTNKNPSQKEYDVRRREKKSTQKGKVKAVKKQKLYEEVEELKKHLQIVLNDDDDDDVYTEAIPLTLKTYCCWYKLMMLDNAADSILRPLEQSVAVDEKMKKYH
nr:putative ribonuclease H-like domain-containing protein [Tanacetum cinerariifolium]